MAAVCESLCQSPVAFTGVDLDVTHVPAEFLYDTSSTRPEVPAEPADMLSTFTQAENVTDSPGAADTVVS